MNKYELKKKIALLRTKILNFSYNIVFFWSIRKIILKIARIKIGKCSYIHTGVRFFSAGRILIGDNSTINPRCYLDNRCEIIIGNNVSIAHDTKIYTLGHNLNDPMFASKGAAVIIKDYACIFAGAMIMPGVTIGKGSVVYPGSVVTKDIDDYCIVGGNPAKVVGKRSKDLRYSLNYYYWFSL